MALVRDKRYKGVWREIPDKPDNQPGCLSYIVLIVIIAFVFKMCSENKSDEQQPNKTTDTVTNTLQADANSKTLLQADSSKETKDTAQIIFTDTISHTDTTTKNSEDSISSNHDKKKKGFFKKLFGRKTKD